jgi:hypothetical protein
MHLHHLKSMVDYLCGRLKKNRVRNETKSRLASVSDGNVRIDGPVHPIVQSSCVVSWVLFVCVGFT